MLRGHAAEVTLRTERPAQAVLQTAELLVGEGEAGDPHPERETKDTGRSPGRGGVVSLFGLSGRCVSPGQMGLWGPRATASQSCWELVSSASLCAGTGLRACGPARDPHSRHPHHSRPERPSAHKGAGPFFLSLVGAFCLFPEGRLFSPPGPREDIGMTCPAGRERSGAAV